MENKNNNNKVEKAVCVDEKCPTPGVSHPRKPGGAITAQGRRAGSPRAPRGRRRVVG